jgi:hypothetical protein
LFSVNSAQHGVGKFPFHYNRGTHLRTHFAAKREQKRRIRSTIISDIPTTSMTFLSVGLQTFFLLYQQKQILLAADGISAQCSLCSIMKGSWTTGGFVYLTNFTYWLTEKPILLERRTYTRNKKASKLFWSIYLVPLSDVSITGALPRR